MLVLVLLAGCVGGRHRRHDMQAVFSASWGEPISGSSLGFDGKGDARNLGAGVEVQRFLADRWAVGVRLGGRSYDDDAAGRVTAAELEGVARHYLFELEPVGFLFEVSGGGSFADGELPAGGTSTNWVWGFGPTLELRLGDSTDLLLGYQWRHLSNGRGGDEPTNPTQNDHRFWIGVAVDW